MIIPRVLLTQWKIELLKFLPCLNSWVEVRNAVVFCFAKRGVLFRVGVKGDVSVIKDVVSEMMNLIETLNTEKVSRAAQTLNSRKLFLAFHTVNQNMTFTLVKKRKPFGYDVLLNIVIGLPPHSYHQLMLQSRLKLVVDLDPKIGLKPIENERMQLGSLGLFFVFLIIH